jgi:DNA polymerase-3 subunit alpha
VAGIGTTQRFHVKAALRQTIKTLDPSGDIEFDSEGKRISKEGNRSFEFENEIMDTLPKGPVLETREGIPITTVQEACDAYPAFDRYMESYPKVKEIAEKLTGNVASYGTHAGGKVLSPVPLERICPLHVTRRTKKKEDRTVVTQFTMDQVELMGLIKFDILGVATKTAIDWAVKWIKDGKGVDINLARLPLDDKKTIDLLKSGNTDGCFQLEGGGMQRTLRDIGVDSFNDLVLTVAMFRPGPKQYIPDICARKRGTVTATPTHPLLSQITSDTYGIICYQEQVMQAFMKIANLPADDGYMFQKGCAKKKYKIIAAYKEAFFRGARSNGLSDDVTTKIWNDLEVFAGYSFNLSHAVSYAYESWKTAYLKAHFPTEFIAARLSVESIRREFDDVSRYVKDAEDNFGFTIKSVDLNKSKIVWTMVGEGVIRPPLLVKDLGYKAARNIVEHQPYDGGTDGDMLYALAHKVGPIVNSKAVTALHGEGIWPNMSKAEAVDGFAKIKDDRKKTKGKQTGDHFE